MSRRRQDDEEDDEPHVYCYVPGEEIDVIVLATYLKKWVDGTATIRPIPHPRVSESVFKEAVTQKFRMRSVSASKSELA